MKFYMNKIPIPLAEHCRVTISIMWNKKTISKLLSVFFALLLWQIIATIVGLDILLVSPVKVLERLATLWLEPDFWQTITFSLSLSLIHI